MKIVVLSDVHGNLPALELFLKKENNCDQYIFLGDAVNYGPWGDECVELISGLKNTICLKGNHEEYFIHGKYSGKNQLGFEFFDKCYPTFNKFDIIKSFIKEYKLHDFTFMHTLNNENIYPDTELNLDTNYFIGHSHYQYGIKNNGFKLFNPGSIGQNRKYINTISYLKWFPFEDHVEFVNLKYNVDLIINELIKRGFSNNCINYYKGKKQLL